MAEQFTQADNEMARKLQLALVNAIFKQIENDPLSVSASTLAVAERLLARYNVGLGWGVQAHNEGEMNEDEKKAIEEARKEFESLGIALDFDNFEQPE